MHRAVARRTQSLIAFTKYIDTLFFEHLSTAMGVCRVHCNILKHAYCFEVFLVTLHLSSVEMVDSHN